MILLFEIARRLVALEDPSDKKVQYDVLPIGTAIARIVKSLELGSKDICTFDDVFLVKGKFHCFTGKPKERRKAIDEINGTTLEIAKKKGMLDATAPPTDPAKVFAMKVNRRLEELKQMFCSEEQQEDILAKTLAAVKIKVADSTAWSMKTNTEIHSAFDYT